MLAINVKRHHALEKIIGDQLEGTMKRIKFEPRIIKDALDNEDWVEEMNEEI